MFTLFSGPFHPYLESTLVETVQRIKSVDPRIPFAIIVPSESLRRRLQWLLCVEKEYALFNVHFLTFHQFALRLDAERRAVSPAGAPVPSLELVGDLFYEYALSIILQQNRSAANLFALRAESSGLCPALWRTIQDLQEAQVEPSVVLRGLQEGLFEKTATARLQGVLEQHAVLQAWSGQLGVGLPDDLSSSVIPWITQSPFISRLSAAIYYGFYDITQVQLSLLEEVARATAVTVFFPIVKGQASQFAQRFFRSPSFESRCLASIGSRQCWIITTRAGQSLVSKNTSGECRGIGRRTHLHRQGDSAPCGANGLCLA